MHPLFQILSLINALTLTPLTASGSAEKIFQIQGKECVYQIDTLNQISRSQPDDTLFLFDLDDTIFDFPYLLGSKAWRKYIRDATIKMGETQNWHDILTLHLAQNYPIMTAEPITTEFVKDLQDNRYVVCGLTSRERTYWYQTPQDRVDQLTIQQLQSLNIDFNNQSLEKIYPYLALDSEYYQGVYFANTDNKGIYLMNLLKMAPQLPKKVIFADDKRNQVEAVAKVLSELGIEHECYFYTATEEKANRFDPLIANIQLYYFLQSDGRQIVTDQEATAIAAENPQKSAENYLREALELAKRNTL